MPLKVVETRRLYQVVADQIADAIRAGEYCPGGRLPPERDLSRECGVSRPVVREAMIALEIAGIVEVRGGSGVYVRATPSPSTRMPDAGEDPYEAFLARQVIEGEIAAIAAKTATQDDIAELRLALELMRTTAQRGPGPDRNDRRFHLALVKSTHNMALLQVMHFIWDELLSAGGELWAKLRERRSVRPNRIADHEAILAAIEARDPAAARQAMHHHFDGAIRDFLHRDGPLTEAQASTEATPRDHGERLLR